MSDRCRATVTAYLAAVAATVAAVTLRWLLDPLMGDTLPLVTLFGAVAAAVWVGGYRPALLVTVAGYLACDYLFIEPRGSFSLGDVHILIGLIAYLLTCAIIIGFCEAVLTARRRAEMRRETLQVTLASMGDAVIATDADGRVTSLNPVAVALTGWTQEEAAGRPLAEVFRIVNERTRQPVENPVKKVLAWGKIVGLANHTTLIAKDGSERPIDDSAAPIRDAEGHVRGVVLIFRDLTERRAIRRESEDRFRLIQIVTDSMSAPVTRCSSDFRYLWVSKPYASWIGQPPEEIIGRPIVEVIGAEAFEQLMPYFRRVLSGERVSYEEAVSFQGMGRRWIHAVYTPTVNSDGTVDGWVAVVIDMHERRQIEERLRKKNERLALLSEAAALMLGAQDPDAMLRSLFAKIAPHLGLDCYFNYMVDETGEGLRLAACAGIPSETASAMNRLEFGQAICGTVALSRQPMMAHRIQHLDDSNVQLVKSLGIRAYVCNPLQVDNHLLGTMSFASRSRDEFDANELDFLRTICHHVAVACERLRLVEQLREADRRKDEFLATLAHELRNPLAPVRNAVQILQLKGPPVPELQWARDVIDRQMAQMARLIDDLMDVSRITRGVIDLKRERVELAKVVQGAVETSRPLIEQQGHDLWVQLPAEPVYLHADMTRLAQVFSNLLNNAAKYTERGGRIDLTAERQGSDVVVSVKDTGIGIPADKLPRVFEMFSQLHVAMERSHGGLGIGLSLVKRLVEMHGGTVGARSAGPGMGSEFVVRLPIAVGQAHASGQTSGDEQPAPAASLRILVVDDNRDNADSLAAMLRIMGNETRTAYDGDEALRAAEEFRPRVVLLDIGLPKLSGYEVCRRIREQPWGRRMVLIAVTGWGQDDDKRRAEAAGFDRHMVKPVKPQALMKVLTLISPSDTAVTATKSDSIRASGGN